MPESKGKEGKRSSSLNLPKDLEGYWIDTGEQVGLDEFLTVSGVGWIKRKAASLVLQKEDLEIEFLGDTGMKFSPIGPMNSRTDMCVGSGYEETVQKDPKGDKVTIRFDSISDDKVKVTCSPVKKGGVTMHLKWTMKGSDKMTQVMSCTNAEGKSAELVRKYNRKNSGK
eukprot:g2565.t1